MSFKEPQIEKVLLSESQSEPDRAGLETELPDMNEAPANGETMPSVSLDLGIGYRVLDIVGEGGMGFVYKVERIATGEFLAAKVLRPEFATDKNAVDRFKQEALACQRLDHKNIVRVDGLGTTSDGTPCIFMEYIKGGSLADLIKAETKLEPWKANLIFTQIARAIEHAHKHGIVHRDLKPSNVLLATDDDEKILVKLVDFGIAKAISRQGGETMGLTKTGDIFGSPAYMSPEQCLGEPVDHRTDLYSFGCIMYETLSGVNPFYAENAVKSILKHVDLYPDTLQSENPRDSIPSDLETAVFRCLEKKPGSRADNASDLVKTFIRLSGERPPRSLSWRVIANSFDLVVLAWLVGICAFAIHNFAGEPYSALCLVLIPFYFAICESTLRATPGKLLFSQRVSNGTSFFNQFFRSFFSSSACIALIVLLVLSVPAINVTLALCHQPCLPTWVQDWFALFVMSALAIYWMPVWFKQPSMVEAMFDCRVHDRPLLQPPKTYGRRPVDPPLKKWQWCLGVLAFLILALMPTGNGLIEKYADTLPWIPKTTVVYGIRDVREAGKITAQDVAVKVVPSFRAPSDAVHSIAEVEGRVSKYGMSVDQIIGSHELMK